MLLRLIGLCLLMLVAGCARTQATAVSNPVFVRANNSEGVWEGTVEVIHSFHFPIVRENKLAGIIESDYVVGSGVLEPWHSDSPGIENRLESSLQSIRRRAFINITTTDGGYLLGVEVFKEREDLRGYAETTAGGATFRDSNPLERDLNLVVGQSAPSGWIPLGRDPALEQSILSSVQTHFAR